MQKAVYLDGSGGVNTKDRRNRSCGWAWISTDGDINTEKGQYGSLTGKQTVPRSEATALHKCMRHMVHGVNDAEYIVYIDNQATYQKWHSMMYVKRFTEQLWEDIYNTMLLLEIKNIKLDLRLLENYYKSIGYYDAKIISNSAEVIDREFAGVLQFVASVRHQQRR